MEETLNYCFPTMFCTNRDQTTLIPYATLLFIIPIIYCFY